MIISALLLTCLAGVLVYGLKLAGRASRLPGLLIVGASMLAMSFVGRPDLATALANVLGVGRGADLLLYLLFILVVSLVLMAHARFRRQDVEITELARAVALTSPRIPGDHLTVSEPPRGRG